MVEFGTYYPQYNVSFTAGDVFRVSVESGVVKYKKNGVVYHTSPGILTYPLKVDSALYTTNSTLTNVVVGGNWSGGSGGGGGSSSSEVLWLVADHLGTPRMILDETGWLANMKRHDYLPFGEELVAGTGGRTQQQGYTASDNVRQKFTSKERDIETGLEFFISRYYSSSHGRFTSADSLLGRRVNPQSLNRYVYVLNNPLKFIDPLGYEGEEANRKRGKKGENESPPEVIEDIIVITVNDAEQQRAKRRADFSVLDAPVFANWLFCPTGICRGTSVRQVAEGAVQFLGKEAQVAQRKILTIVPDGVNISASFFWLASGSVTFTPDFDVFGSVDFGGGWAGAIQDGVNDARGGKLGRGIGISLTGTYIADATTRDLNGQISLTTDAREVRHRFFTGPAFTAMGCYRACIGTQRSGSGFAGVLGVGQGTTIGPTYGIFLGRVPVERLPKLRIPN